MQTFITKLQTYIKEGDILFKEPMSGHTSFRVGGPADYFVQPASREEIREAIMAAKEEKVPFFVIGNGSNLLVSDRGWRGMILQVGKNYQEITVDDNIITARSGATLARVAKEALDHSLTGMEFAAGIPGSVGGAVAMNAGAYDGEIRNILLDAEVMTSEGEFITIPAADLDLSYRHSCVFEKDYLVLSARFLLAPGDPGQIRSRMDELARARKEKQPLEYPSAGSTFKRPKGYFAGKLIQDAGLKGYTVGGAQVSEKHSGFVINRGGATAEEIAFLIAQVQKKVEQQFGVRMEPEVRFVGFEEGETACHFLQK